MMGVLDKPIADYTDEELGEAKKKNSEKLRKEEKEYLEHVFSSVLTSEELLDRDFPEPSFIVPGLLPIGLSLIAGAPKIGKSWFALQLAIALACGGYMLGNIKVDARPVLYVALEDTLRRLCNRLKKMKAPKNKNLHLTTEWDNGKKALDRLRYYKVACPELEVVIVDTWAAFRGRPDGDGYAFDYSDMAALRDLGNELSLSIILIHHKRKSEALDDPFDEILGSQGVCGVVDTALLIKRERRKHEAVLHMTSRDIEEAEIILQFDGDIGSWSVLGDADFMRLSRERKDILEALDELGEVTLSQIASFVKKDKSNICHLLHNLVEEGFITKSGHGKYVKKERE